MPSRAKKQSREDGKAFMRNALGSVQQLLEANLSMSSETITHDGTMGDVNEKHWIDILRNYLPNRYAVDTGIVIDSRGQTSEQIDIIIYDMQYTPSLLAQQTHQYIPAEAVYGVFEAKPTINKAYLDYAGSKAASVRRLYRTSVPIPHAGGEYAPKEHFEIIAGIVAAKSEWTDGLGKAFKVDLKRLDGEKRLDCGCALADGAFDRFNKNESLRVVPADGALGFYLFRLLKKLQDLGTVPAIDWNAYAQLLR